MNINIELSDYQCEELLVMNGYVTEDVTAYFYANTDPYNENSSPNDLRGVNFKIAYHKMDRPEELNKEHPMLDVVKKHAYRDVINELFNSRLNSLIFGY